LPKTLRPTYWSSPTRGRSPALWPAAAWPITFARVEGIHRAYVEDANATGGVEESQPEQDGGNDLD